MVGADRHRYIVALDFGTTFTGISHVNVTKKTIDDIQVIKNWPGPSKEFAEVWKTPSKIAYRSENAHVINIKDDAGEVIWGYDVEPGMVSYSWMKLRLDEHTKITEFDDTSLAGLTDSQGDGLLRLPRGRTALDVCTDYLTGVYKYTMEELHRTWTETVVKATPIDFWITVPATWSDRAKDMTKTAALTAGFSSRSSDRMFLITEPEAAAVATLTGLIGEGVENQVKPGDGILVCDCGGGTVDINTYRITSTTPTLDFEELAVGQGGKVGSTFIDRQFHEWMGAHFGRDFYALEFKKKGPGSRFMKEFEAIKRDFGGTRSAQKEFRIPLKIKNAADSSFYDEDENMVIVTRDEMKAFFEPSVTKIKHLLQEQIKKANFEMEDKKTVRTIILVGGFGDSKYLFESLRDWCKANGNLRLLCPPNPQAAIVKGAALRGLGDIKPSRRRARRHYGFQVSRPFIEGVHPQRLSFLEQWTGLKYCSSLFAWKINKGDFMTEQTKITNKLFETWSPGDSKSGSLRLYASSQDNPAKYHSDGGFEFIGAVDYDFEDLDMSLCPTKIIDGRRTYYISYNVEILLGDKRGMLVVKVVSKGEEIGNATLDFNRLENMSSGLGMRAYAS